MVLCKFFQQGYCRFGKGCRFEHEYASKYSYHANAPQQSSHPAPSGVSDEQLVAQLVADSASAINSGQWIMSTYHPFTEKPSFPGFVNLSPEEARLFIYEAKANNTLDNAVTHINNLVKEYKSKYEQLARPTQQIIKVYRSIYNGEAVPSPFVSNTTTANPFTGSSGTNSAASIFKSTAQAPGFGNNQSNSIFGVNNGTSSFAQPNQAQSIFAQASQNVFQQKQEAFNQQANPASIFASTNQNFQNQTQTNQSGNIFGNWAQNTPQYQNQAQSVFSQAKPISDQQANVFAQLNPQSFQTGQSSNVFGQSTIAQPTDDMAYSKMEDLKQDDIDMYMSDDFKLGFVPEMPPPHSLCM